MSGLPRTDRMRGSIAGRMRPRGRVNPISTIGHAVIGLERRTGEKSQVRLAHEAEVAERKQADQVIDNEIAVERDEVCWS